MSKNDHPGKNSSKKPTFEGSHIRRPRDHSVRRAIRPVNILQTQLSQSQPIQDPDLCFPFKQPRSWTEAPHNLGKELLSTMLKTLSTSESHFTKRCPTNATLRKPKQSKLAKFDYQKASQLQMGSSFINHQNIRTCTGVLSSRIRLPSVEILKTRRETGSGAK